MRVLFQFCTYFCSIFFVADQLLAMKPSEYIARIQGNLNGSPQVSNQNAHTDHQESNQEKVEKFKQELDQSPQGTWGQVFFKFARSTAMLWSTGNAESMDLLRQAVDILLSKLSVLTNESTGVQLMQILHLINTHLKDPEIKDKIKDLHSKLKEKFITNKAVQATLVDVTLARAGLNSPQAQATSSSPSSVKRRAVLDGRELGDLDNFLKKPKTDSPGSKSRSSTPSLVRTLDLFASRIKSPQVQSASGSPTAPEAQQPPGSPSIAPAADSSSSSSLGIKQQDTEIDEENLPEDERLARELAILEPSYNFEREALLEKQMKAEGDEQNNLLFYTELIRQRADNLAVEERRLKIANIKAQEAKIKAKKKSDDDDLGHESDDEDSKDKADSANWDQIFTQHIAERELKKQQIMQRLDTETQNRTIAPGPAASSSSASDSKDEPPPPPLRTSSTPTAENAGPPPAPPARSKPVGLTNVSNNPASSPVPQQPTASAASPPTSTGNLETSSRRLTPLTSLPPAVAKGAFPIPGKMPPGPLRKPAASTPLSLPPVSVTQSRADSESVQNESLPHLTRASANQGTQSAVSPIVPFQTQTPNPGVGNAVLNQGSPKSSESSIAAVSAVGVAALLGWFLYKNKVMLPKEEGQKDISAERLASPVTDEQELATAIRGKSIETQEELLQQSKDPSDEEKEKKENDATEGEIVSVS